MADHSRAEVVVPEADGMEQNTSGPRAEACGFCNLGVYDWKGSLIACPYCDGTGFVQ